MFGGRSYTTPIYYGAPGARPSENWNWALGPTGLGMAWLPWLDQPQCGQTAQSGRRRILRRTADGQGVTKPKGVLGSGSDDENRS